MLRLPVAAVSLGRSAGWAALDGHIRCILTESATRSSTSCRAGPASGGQLRSALSASVDEAVQGQQGGAGEGSSPSATATVFADAIPDWSFAPWWRTLIRVKTHSS